MEVGPSAVLAKLNLFPSLVHLWPCSIVTNAPCEPGKVEPPMAQEKKVEEPEKGTDITPGL